MAMATDAEPAGPETASPRRLLVDWANAQDAWVRHLAGETILNGQAPSEALLDAVYATFLAEKGLSDSSATVDIPKLELASTEDVIEEALELISLSQIQGVNALAPDQVLSFDPSLTIIFGQNGSGKTGYARILKRLAAVRTAEGILPNAHAVHLSAPPSPSAHIAYRVDHQERAILWSNESGLAPFTRISVFDAGAVSLHVDSDLGYIYTPAELALFAHVASGLQGIQQRIAAEAKNLTPGTNPLVQRFARETRVYPLIETLGASTDLHELDALGTLADDADSVRERLEGEVAALRSNNLDALVANSEESERQLARLAEVLDAAQRFDDEAYEVARTNLATAERRRVEAREQLFASDDLAGPPDERWQEFVVAGDAYRRHLGREEYPCDGDRCLYCMQTLDSVALDLLRRYRAFLDETLVSHVGEAGAALERACLHLSETERVTVAAFATARLDSPTATWAQPALDALAQAGEVASETASAKAVSRRGLSTVAQAVLREVSAARSEAAETVASLRDARANATAALSVKQKELVELVARIELKRNLPTVHEYVRRAKRAQQLEVLSRSISNGAAKQLTVQSKLASEDLVNRNFESLFSEECARLRAPQVALRFQGRSGQAQRKKVVASYKPSSVLSEGEQKVLALADFLAESRMRGTKAPLVFDDPVTSLDYRRLDEVAGRIHALAETHQVIVLTHNIMFASALIAARQNKKSRVKVYEVRDGGDAKGILAPDVEPRLDTPADLAKRVNGKLQDIPAADAAVQDALIREAYDLIRAWCEAFVEQELLQNVTQRYRRNVMMTRLSRIDSSRLDAAIAVIEPLFDRACERMTGHSHAAEHMSVKPTLAELKDDWEKARAARAAYIAD